MQRLQLLRAGAFDSGIQQLAEVARGHAAGVRHLLQSTGLLADHCFQVIKRRHYMPPAIRDRQG